MASQPFVQGLAALTASQKTWERRTGIDFVDFTICFCFCFNIMHLHITSRLRLMQKKPSVYGAGCSFGRPPLETHFLTPSSTSPPKICRAKPFQLPWRSVFMKKQRFSWVKQLLERQKRQSWQSSVDEFGESKMGC